jgi:hypothetical protein
MGVIAANPFVGMAADIKLGKKTSAEGLAASRNYIARYEAK